MKTVILAALAAASLAGAASAQAPAAAPAAAAATPAAGALSVQTTKISAIVTNAKGKAVLEAAIPEISQYYDQIGDMTLAEVAPMSQGAIDDAKLKAIQAEFDKIG